MRCASGIPSARARRAPGAASFRLSEVRTLHDPADPGDDPDDQTGDGTHWILEFFLQSTADPSLLVPAAQVWDGRAARLLADPQELLLAELGRAARVMPDLAPALRAARPESLDLENGGAHQFLTVDAPLLADAGFGVQLPRGWDGSRRVGLTLSARSTPADRVLTRSGLGREELADFRWSVAVGDEELGEEELAELVAAKAQLVRVRGRWVSVDAEKLRAGLAFLRRSAPQRPPTVGEVLALAGRHPDDWAADEEVPLPGHRGARAGLPRRPAGRPGRPGDHAGRHAARASARSCAPTSSGVCRGWRSSPSWGSAPAWPTTWASARRCSCWRWRPHERAGGRAAPDAAALPDVAGRHLAAGGRSGSPPSCGCSRCTGPAARTAPRCSRGGRASDLVVTTYATATRDVDELAAISLAAARARRGAGRQEQPGDRARGRCAGSTPSTGSRSPAPRWRTGCRSCGR